MKFNLFATLKNLSVPHITFILFDVIIIFVLFLSEEPMLYIISAFFIIEIILVITLDRSAFISFKKSTKGNLPKSDC